jgi:hypothetical protein
MESATAKTAATGSVRAVASLGPRQLITNEPWDCYHLESLLPLKETYRETTQFGFLLRHYWIPATILTFRQSQKTTFADGRTEQCDLEIERTMARCRSNECLWREKIRPVIGTNGDRPILSEMLCSYDCYEQTFHSAKPILFALPTAEQKTEARRQALYHLPMLCPPGPVPIGFSWYGKVGDDYMNYRLEAEERLGETSVLVIRREGRYTMWLPESQDEQKAVPVVAQRQGITLFAWNRATVLEDRFLDSVVEANGQLASVVGRTNHAVTRLIRSCPENMSKPVSSPIEREHECQECKASPPAGKG